jgi:hypothetical protein
MNLPRRLPEPSTRPARSRKRRTYWHWVRLAIVSTLAGIPIGIVLGWWWLG